MNAKRVRLSDHDPQRGLSLEGLEDLLERPTLMIAEPEQRQVTTLTNDERKQHTQYNLELIRQLHEMQDLLTITGAQLTRTRNEIADLHSKLSKQTKLLVYNQHKVAQFAKLLTLAVLEGERIKNQWLCRDWLK